MTHYRKSLLDFLPRPGRQYRASLRQCDNFHGVAEHSRLKPGDSPRCRGRPIPTNQGKEGRTKIIAVAAKFLVLHGVRMTQDGLVVNYHCRVSPYLSVDEVHEHVDELDRKMRAAFTGIVRIVGHAEPLRT
jgi:Dimerisation domain of Zinc Transporter